MKPLRSSGAAVVPKRRTTLLLAAGFAFTGGCATAPAPVDEARVARIDALLRTIRPLLELAPGAAQATWPQGPRADQSIWEARLLDAAILRAADYGLPPEVVADFLNAQFEASRRIRAGLHAEWTARKQPPFTQARDLDRDLRARWIAALPELLGALGRAWPALRSGGGRELLEQRARAVLAGVPGGGPIATTAIAPLWQLAR